MVAHNKAVGESCLNLTGPLLQYMDTVSVAKDMEAVRLALGEEELNYLRISYGTQQVNIVCPQNSLHEEHLTYE